MTEHTHSTFVEGCFRCELSRDEAEDIRKQAEKEIDEAMLSVMRRLLQHADLAMPYGDNRNHHLIFNGRLEITENEFDLLTEYADFPPDLPDA